MDNPTDNQTDTQPIQRLEPLPVASVGTALTLLPSASMVGVEIAESLPLDQLTQIASAVGQEEVRRQWLMADIARGLVARSTHPADVAQSLGVPVETVINNVTTSNHWPMAEREEGVPLHVHAEVYDHLIKPLGDEPTARRQGREVLQGWRTGQVTGRDLTRTLKRIETTIRESLQPKLLDVERNTPPTKEAKPQDEEMAGWRTMFTKTRQGKTYIIESGSPATLFAVDSAAYEAFLKEHAQVMDTARNWEILAKKAMDDMEEDDHA